jgi:hypothetical protein
MAISKRIKPLYIIMAISKRIKPLYIIMAISKRIKPLYIIVSFNGATLVLIKKIGYEKAIMLPSEKVKLDFT